MGVELQLQLKLSDGTLDIFTLSQSEIIRVMTDTLGSKVLYYKHGRRREAFVVETPAQVAGLTKTLISVVDDDSVTSYINTDRIVLIDDRTDSVAGSKIKYDSNGAYAHVFNVTATKAALNTTIYEAAGNTAYTIQNADRTTETITLNSSHGDVRGVFAAGNIFSVVGSTGNDGTYVVSSVAFTSSKTVITVTGDITDTTGDGSCLIVTTS